MPNRSSLLRKILQGTSKQKDENFEVIPLIQEIKRIQKLVQSDEQNYNSGIEETDIK